MKRVKDVDEYIALAPKEVQDKLKEFLLITITKADWFISDFQKNISDFTYRLPS
jgi:hypothetical protein